MRNCNSSSPLRHCKRALVVFFIALALCYMLASCGQSGHLYLPVDNSNNIPSPGK